MATARRKLGDLGEQIACERLIALGMSVIERNWRSGHHEVDVIAADAAGLHFVEVKSRTAPVSADPLVGITASKKRSLTKAAREYLSDKRCGDIEIFFDVMTVVFDGESVQVDYYPQAFIPVYT